MIVADFEQDPLRTTIENEEYAIFGVEEDPKEYECSYEEKDHIGQGGIRCSECNWTTSSEQHLYFHRKTLHPDHRPHQCPLCEKCFAKKCNLQAHALVHTGERPFQCSECDSRFTRKGDLDRHSIIHGGERPYGCSLCCSTFTQRPHLVAHMRCHSGERPYQCNMCPASYTRNTHLVRHQRVHFSTSN